MKVTIYKNHFYRFVNTPENLFGRNIHVSGYELGQMDFIDGDYDEHFKMVPFSHCNSHGFLFEFKEAIKEFLSIMPKSYQPGTGVIQSNLREELIIVRRVMYHIDQHNEAQKKHLADLKIQFPDAKFVDINFEELMQNTDNISLVAKPHKIKKVTNSYFFSVINSNETSYQTSQANKRPHSTPSTVITKKSRT